MRHPYIETYITSVQSSIVAQRKSVTIVPCRSGKCAGSFGLRQFLISVPVGKRQRKGGGSHLKNISATIPKT